MKSVSSARLPNVALFAGLALPLLAAGCAQLYDINLVQVGADYWVTDLDGTVEQDNPTLPDTEITDSVLGIDDEDFFNFRGLGQLGPVVVEGSFFSTEWSGNEFISRTIEFDGQVFNIGDQVASDAEIDFISAKVKWGLVGLGPVALGVLVGANYINAELELDSTVIFAADDLEGVFPVVGVVGTVHQELGENFAIFAEAEGSGIQADVDDIDGTYFELSGRAGLQLSALRVGGGYRHLDVDVKDDEDTDWDFELSGPFFFVELAF